MSIGFQSLKRSILEIVLHSERFSKNITLIVCIQKKLMHCDYMYMYKCQGFYRFATILKLPG